MMRTVLLGDIVRIRRGASPRPIQDYIQSTPGVPWVKIADATSANSRFISSTKEYIKEDGRRKSVEVSPGTLILSNSATPGLPMIMKIEACVHDGWLVLDELKGVDRDWLYYFLLNRREISAKAASGSVFSNLKTDIVRRFEVLLPPIGQQKKIANILGSLDEKIELNRRMNETLEQLGQTIFRYHFIANPEVKNWPIVKVGDILSELQSGSRPKGGAVELGVPSIGAENIIGLGKYDYSKEKYISEDFFNKLSRGIVNSEDVLLYKDGAYVGKKSLFMNGFPHKKCAVNEHVFILRANPKLRSQFFLYFWLDQSSITKKIIDAGVKAAQPGINQSNVNSLPILLPPEESVKKFDNEISPIMEMIFSNAVESNHLATFRDALLPKLISGEIEV